MDKNLLSEELMKIQNELEELRRSASETCGCGNFLEVKVRQFGGGNHYVKQCNSCGEQRGGSLKKADTLKLLNGRAPRLFDFSIQEQFQVERSINLDRIRLLDAEEKRINALLDGRPEPDLSLILQDNSFEEASVKLASYVEEMVAEIGELKAIRALVTQTIKLKLKRQSNLSESFDRFRNEAELKEWFTKYLSQDFHIYPEVTGLHLAEKVTVRIDYVLYPKQPLIDAGFTPLPFGVEVKYFNQEHGFTHKASRGLWQTISYNDCQFRLQENDVKLKFALLFSNLSFHNEMLLLKNYGDENVNDPIEWKGMIHIANHAQVGVLQVNGDKGDCRSWSIKFADGLYFEGFLRDGKRTYRKSNENIINKVRVGNF